MNFIYFILRIFMFGNIFDWNKKLFSKAMFTKMNIILIKTMLHFTIYHYVYLI